MSCTKNNEKLNWRYSVKKQGKCSRGIFPNEAFPRWLSKVECDRGWLGTVWKVEGNEVSKTFSTEILLNSSKMLSLHRKNLLMPLKETMWMQKCFHLNIMFKLKIFMQSLYGTRLQNTWANLVLKKEESVSLSPLSRMKIARWLPLNPVHLLSLVWCLNGFPSTAELCNKCQKHIVAILRHKLQVVKICSAIDLFFDSNCLRKDLILSL